MNTTCGERFARIEAKMDGLDRRLDSLESEIKGVRWWILGAWATGVAIVISFAAYQASWFQHSLDVNRDISNKVEARMDKRQEEMDLKFSKFMDEFKAQRLPAKP